MYDAYIEVDENADFRGVLIPDRVYWISLTNKSGEKIDERDLLAKLAKLKNIERVTCFTISYSSKVRDCSFLSAAKNLEALVIHGSSIESTKGIAGLKKLRYLEIDTGQNKRRNIEEIPQSCVTKLKLTCTNPQDLLAINGCCSLKELVLDKCPEFDPEILQDMEIERLTIMGGRFVEIGNLGKLKRLSNLHIAYCRKLERFTRGNENVRSLFVRSSNKLDLESIATFTNLELLRVYSCKKYCSLEFISQMKNLVTFIVDGCNGVIPPLNYKEALVHLRKIWVTSLSNEEVRVISEMNRNVIVSNGKSCYENGIKEPVKVIRDSET